MRKRDRASAIQVGQAIGMLLEAGTELGRPLADRVRHSRLSNLKELRPGSAGRSEIRILYILDPRRNAVLLVAGDKAGKWQAWYRQAIPLAEPDPDVPLDLSPAFATAYKRGRYARILRYQQPLTLPLSADDRAWAETIPGATGG